MKHPKRYLALLIFLLSILAQASISNAIEGVCAYCRACWTCAHKPGCPYYEAPSRGDSGGYEPPVYQPPPIDKGREALNQGIDCYNSGEYEKAINYFLEALKYNPNDVDARKNIASAYNNWGNQFYRNSDYDGAIYRYNKALEWNPYHEHAGDNIRKARQRQKYDIVESYLSTANVNYDNENYNAAIALYKKALEYDPDNSGIRRRISSAYNNMGVNLKRNGDREGAMECYRKALSWSPENEYARNNLNKGEEWLREKPLRDHISNGVKFHNERNYDAAINEYEQALSIDPGNANAKGNLYLAYTAKYSHLSYESGNTAHKYHVEGKYSTAAGYYQDSLQYCIEALRMNPDNSSARKRLEWAESGIRAVRNQLFMPDMTNAIRKWFSKKKESAANLSSVIQTVADNPDKEDFTGRRKCNRFAGYVGRKLDVPYFNHIWTGKPDDHILANNIHEFLQKAVKHRYSGWREISDAEAQKLANRGYFVIASAHGLNAGDIGHVAIVVPAGMVYRPRRADDGSGPLVRDNERYDESDKASYAFPSLSRNPAKPVTITKPIYVVWDPFPRDTP